MTGKFIKITMESLFEGNNSFSNHRSLANTRTIILLKNGETKETPSLFFTQDTPRNEIFFIQIIIGSNPHILTGQLQQFRTRLYNIDAK